MAAVACDNLSKSFGAVQAVSGVSFSLDAGETLLILGHSGSGKTTLLRMIAGLETPDEGTVRIGERVVSNGRVAVPPHRRGLAMLFQRPTLWPHLRVLDNVALGLCGRNMRRKARRAAAREALAELEMTGRERAWPATLSGGELQRAALARALVAKPRLLLLDEPFASLDLDLRRGLVSTFDDLKRRHGVTVIWVSHRFEEALQLADRALLLRGGRVEACGPPEEVLNSE